MTFRTKGNIFFITIPCFASNAFMFSNNYLNQSKIDPCFIHSLKNTYAAFTEFKDGNI